MTQRPSRGLSTRMTQRPSRGLSTRMTRRLTCGLSSRIKMIIFLTINKFVFFFFDVSETRSDHMTEKRLNEAKYRGLGFSFLP